METTAALQKLDPEVIEARTVEIGRELIATAKEAHAHFSVMNRWTEQVLSWCMGDPAVKSAVLRLVDVLPTLQHSRDVARHVREYFPSTALRLPVALRLGSSLARPGVLTAPAVAAIVRQLVEHVARQFIAESETGRVQHVVRELAAAGATCSLDVLGEQVLSEAEADAYAAQYARLLDEAVAAYAALPASQMPLTCGSPLNLSVKASALACRFDPICPAASLRQVHARLWPLVQRAAAHGGVVNVDMEHFELRDLTVALVQELVEKTAPGAAPIGFVVQAYLRDAEAMTENLLAWLRARQRMLHVRLVKGAYWDAEVAQAAQRHWPVPVHEDKAETDAAFERLTRRLLAAHPMVTTAVASHNIRSIAHAMAVAEALALPKRALEFQLLYGMGEAIHAAIGARGYPVRIYTPIGALIPGMGYLVRRLLENTANESFLRQDFVNERSGDALLKAPQPCARAASAGGDDAGAQTWRNEPPRDFAVAQRRDTMVTELTRLREQGPEHYLPLIDATTVRTSERMVARNPAAPDRVLGEVSLAAVSDAERAVATAVRAQAGWASTPAAERRACLRRAAALMRERRDRLAAWEVVEVGKTWREADGDVIEAIDYLEYYAARMEQLAQGQRLVSFPGEQNTYRYGPRGVAAVIAPWNFPLAIPTGMVCAALVAGNAVVFKPAEQSSIMGSVLVQLLHEAGVPPRVVQYVPGIGETIGAYLVGHADVAQILFTGSRAVGLEILRTAAEVREGQRQLKHVVTEMGGKNAIIVDADADLDAALAGTLVSAFGYGGQKCSAASRLIVHEAVAERFVARLAAAADRLVIGDPADARTDYGPLIDEAAQRRLRQAATAAAAAGTIVYRCPDRRLPRQGYFVGPTVVADIDPQHPVAREELFGPMLCVFRVASFDEALALANASEYALTGGIYSRSPRHVAHAMAAFDVGNLYVNRPITGAIVGRQPFGGHRFSGLGTKAGGPDYLLQVVLPKSVCEDTRRHGMPLE